MAAEVIDLGRQCQYPGCAQPAEAKQPGVPGPSPRYCTDPEHNAKAAHRARQRRDDADTGAPATGVDRARGDLAALHRDLEALVDRVETAGQDMRAALALVADPEQLAAAVEQIASGAQAEVAAAEAARAEAEADAAAARAQRDAALERETAAETARAQAEQARGDLERRLLEADSDRAEAVALHRDAEQRAEAAEAAAAEATRRADAAETDRDHARGELAAERDRAAGLAAQLEACEPQNRELTARIDELTAERDELGKAVARAEADRRASDAKAAAQRKRVAELVDQLAAREARIDALLDRLTARDPADAEAPIDTRATND